VRFEARVSPTDDNIAKVTSPTGVSFEGLNFLEVLKEDIFIACVLLCFNHGRGPSSITAEPPPAEPPPAVK
jgi:hypothetical protein